MTTPAPTPDDDNGDALADALEGKRPAGTDRRGALDDHERESLTFVGQHVSAQVRTYADLANGGSNTVLAIHHRDGAPRARESGRPWEVNGLDANRLLELLECAAGRGLL